MRSQALQELNEISLLRVAESEVPYPVVVRDHVGQRCGAAVMEVRRMLRQAAQRRRPVCLVRRTRRVCAVDTGLVRRVQLAVVVVRPRSTDVAARTRAIEQCAPAPRGRYLSTSDR